LPSSVDHFFTFPTAPGLTGILAALAAGLVAGEFDDAPGRRVSSDSLERTLGEC
jgi:hypothetical protein